MTFQQVLNNGGADPLTNRGRRSSIPRPFHSFGNLRGDLSTYAALQVVNKGGDLLDAETGDRLELHAICCRLPTMRPSQGHRSRTLRSDLVQTGGLSRSGGECAQDR